MRYAIISDIHANRQAWESVLADIDEQGADVVICLGDVIGYGPMPQAVLDAVRERAAAVVLGNHDAAVCDRMDSSIFNDHARSVIEWTRGKLDDDALNYLAEIPLAVEGDDILFVHAEVIEPGRFDYILDPEKAVANLAACSQRFVFYGHTHYPCAFALQNGSAAELTDADFGAENSYRYLVNVGSAGEPRNPEDLRARYVIFDSDSGGIFFRRVEFDIDAYRKDLKREKLDIRPYFIQIADFESGRRIEAVIPGSNAMNRLPVVPASRISDQPRRLVLAPQHWQQAGKAAPTGEAMRLAADRHAKESANRMWTIIAIAIAVVLLPVIWLVGKRAADVLSYTPAANAAAAAPKTTATPTTAAVAPPAPARAASSNYLRDRLLSYWPANDKDEATNGRLRIGPVAHGKPKRIRGKFDSAFTLNNTSGLSFGDPDTYAIENGGSLTIAFWYQPQKPGQQIRFILGTESPRDGETKRGWSIYSNHKKLGILVGSGEQIARVEHETGPVARAAWQHVAVVIDAADGELLLFHNGMRVAKKDIAPLGKSIPAARPLTLGREHAKDRKFNFQGKIDDLAIWERPLGMVEITDIFRRGNIKKEPLGKLLSQ